MHVVQFWQPGRIFWPPHDAFQIYASLVHPRPKSVAKVVREVLKVTPIREQWDHNARVACYRHFHDTIKASAGVALNYQTGDEFADIRSRLARLSPRARAALLLIGPMSFSMVEASVVLRIGLHDMHDLFVSSLAEIDGLTRLNILQFDEHETVAAYLSELLGSHHDIVVTDDFSKFASLAGNKPWSLFLTETRSNGSGCVVTEVQRLAQCQDTPVIFFTAYPEDLIENGDTCLAVLKPTFSELLTAAVRQQIFWGDAQLAARPPIPLAFSRPLTGDSEAQFVPEFQSHELPHQLPRPFDWVKKDRSGMHVFLRPEQRNREGERFPDLHLRERFEPASQMIEAVIGTGNDTILLAALAVLEHEVHDNEWSARNAEASSDRRRFRRATALFDRVKAAYLELIPGHAKAQQDRKADALNYARQIAGDLTYLRGVEWRGLEEIVHAVFSELGFDARLTSSSGDLGRDTVLEYFDGEDHTILVEVKHWRSGRRVGKALVAQFAKNFRDGDTALGILLSTSGFWSNAASSLTSIQLRKISLAGPDYLQHICKLLVRKEAGGWTVPKDRNSLLPAPLPPD
jgi:restriction endonuclease